MVPTCTAVSRCCTVSPIPHAMKRLQGTYTIYMTGLWWVSILLVDSVIDSDRILARRIAEWKLTLGYFSHV